MRSLSESEFIAEFLLEPPEEVFCGLAVGEFFEEILGECGFSFPQMPVLEFLYFGRAYCDTGKPSSNISTRDARVILRQVED